MSGPDDKAIFHLALESDWEAATGDGSYRISSRGQTLDEVGFIHAAFEQQLPGVAARYYAGVGEPLLVLTIDPERLDVPLVVERPEGVEEAFPHIYGPLSTASVVAVHRATMAPDGRLEIESKTA